jgi:hypothetical protein
MIGEVYAIAEYTILGFVKEFCKMVRLHLEKINYSNPKLKQT